MSEMLPLTGEVVFNKLMQPDVFMGNSKYTLTIALDKDGKKLAEKNGLATKEYDGKLQITAKRKVDFGQPKVFNSDKEEVDASHVSLFGDKVTMLVKKVRHLTMLTHTLRGSEWMPRPRVWKIMTSLTFNCIVN